MFRKLNLSLAALAAGALLSSAAMARDLVINFDDLNPGPKEAFDAAIEKFKAENPDITSGAFTTAKTCSNCLVLKNSKPGTTCWPAVL